MWASVIRSKQMGQMKSMFRSWPGIPDAEAPDAGTDEAAEDCDGCDDDPGPGEDTEGPEPGRGLFAGLGSPSDIVNWRENLKKYSEFDIGGKWILWGFSAHQQSALL